MQKIWEFSTQPYMVIWTALFGILFLLSIAALIFGDLFDFDSDTDANIDGGFLKSVFSFMDLGHVPVTFLLMTFSAMNWGTGLILNNLINSGHSKFLGFLLLIPTFFVAFAATKIINIPVKKLYAAMNGDNEKMTEIIGNFCTTTSEVDNTNGYASVVTGTSPIQIMVYTEGDKIDKGTNAVILEYNTALRRYLISEASDQIFEN